MSQDDPILTPRQKPGDETLDKTLRPATLDEFIGQQKLKENLSVFIEAAKKRKEPLDHCLFSGPPGLGKTTLAYIIARELGGNIKITSGPVMERTGDLAAILTGMDRGDIFFIDEIHRMNRTVEESLYPALEDFKLDIVIGQGPSAKNIRLDLSRFTLIGATTRAGLLTGPLRERFGIVYNLEFYTPEEMKKIVKRSAQILGIEIDEAGAEEIAKRSRFTPRISNRLLKRVRDFAEVRGSGVIDCKMAGESLEAMGVDRFGLDSTDRRLLSVILTKFGGGPVGIETIAAATQEETDSISDVYEPFLIQAGFLARTSRGRVATALAAKHLKLSLPKTDDLFKV